MSLIQYLLFFFFNDTATTEIYTLSLHDALPISAIRVRACRFEMSPITGSVLARDNLYTNINAHFPRFLLCFYFYKDRKSTRLNSSHANISYAVFCLKKKKNIHRIRYFNGIHLPP